MHTKNRKLNKEELELWKLVTKNDKILGNYTKNVEKDNLFNKKEVLPIKKEKNETLEARKNNFLSQNIQINNRMKVKLERGIIRPETRLDLHGKTLIEAKQVLITFIKTCVESNIRCVLIITGKKKTLHGSKGLIRENLPIWLKDKGMYNYVLFHCYATKRDGDDGARYILLRKKHRVFNG
ncbi:MAG: hypothetical protein CBC22_03190 [Alphaproteobacteria bacterium TMED62]|nr:MAG: hypothetical protein CBC22_03190 [Alphaproteobacteria bacterium TMED62]|tara:strand:- start:10785 stop:11327 length:543 start_codon:yes stop_codon:yes gene_type:complete